MKTNQTFYSKWKMKGFFTKYMFDHVVGCVSCNYAFYSTSHTRLTNFSWLREDLCEHTFHDL